MQALHHDAIKVAVETIRSALRALPTDEDRAHALHTVTSPTTEGDIRKRIEDALRSAGSVQRAAELLGVGKRTLTDKMRELGFERRPAGRPRKL